MPATSPSPNAARPVPRRPITTPFHRFSDATRRAFVLGFALASVVGALALVAWLFPLRVTAGEDASSPPPGMFSHSVFFTLADPTPENRVALVAACREHLAGHDGTVFFAAGERDPGMARDVNDTDFDVALLLVFRTKDQHDKYQTHPRHLKFVRENDRLWETVRVFDADIGPE